MSEIPDFERRRILENLKRFDESMLKMGIKELEKSTGQPQLRLKPPKPERKINKRIRVGKRTLIGIFIKYKNALWTVFIVLLTLALSIWAHLHGWL